LLNAFIPIWYQRWETWDNSVRSLLPLGQGRYVAFSEAKTASRGSLVLAFDEAGKELWQHDLDEVYKRVLIGRNTRGELLVTQWDGITLQKSYVIDREGEFLSEQNWENLSDEPGLRSPKDFDAQ